ncbi:MAG: hypothetical protein IIV61_01940 [Oscillospiraceae bacterium]|nr:hypothetical protein [Oscillospiraceae bacterium]
MEHKYPWEVVILERKKKNGLIWLAVGGLVLAVAAVAVAVWAPWREPDRSEVYVMAEQAIVKTEAKEDLGLQISSAAMITDNGTLRKTDTNGYIYKVGDQGRVIVYVNTKSTTPEDPSRDFDVTVSMVSDGQKVYDISGPEETEVDMTCQEFDQIVSGLSFYRYREEDAVEVRYEENELEAFDGGELSVTLSRPGAETLDAIAGSLSEMLAEPVDPEKLVTVEARVDMSVYDGELRAQSCNFTVEHTCQDGRKVRYATATHVVLLEDSQGELPTDGT